MAKRRSKRTAVQAALSLVGGRNRTTIVGLHDDRRRRGGNSSGEGTFDHFAAMFDTEKLGGTSSATKELVMPYASGVYTTHWGDGSSDTLNTHTYASEGEWLVEIFTPVTTFRYANLNDKIKLVNVLSLGDGFELNQGAFQGCINMVWETTDTPIIQAGDQNSTLSQCELFNPTDTSTWDWSATTSLSNTFFGAYLFVGNGAESWDVSNVESFSQAFFATHAFAAPIGSWDVSSATNIQGMFRQNNGFNQDLNGWGSKTQNIQQFNHVFAGATSFTGDLDQWDMGSATTTHAMFSSNYNGDITPWVFTSTIKDMSWMFASNNTFNQNIGGWNTASVTNMSNMLGGASAFDQELTWTVGSVTNMATMLDNCGMSQANYDKWLLNLDAQTLQTSISMGASGLTYSGFGAPAAARASLVGAPDLMSITGDSSSQVPDSAYNFTKFADLIPGSGANDVLAWVDYVGIDNLAQSTGANQPLFNVDHIEFNGGDHLNQLVSQTGDFTYITKFKATSDAIQVLLGDVSNTNVYVALISEQFRYKPSSGTSYDTSLVYNNTGPHIVTVTRSGSDIKIYIEEDEVLSASDASAIELDRVGDRGGSSLGFIGNMYHLLSYSVALSPTEIQQQIEALDVL